MRLTQHLLKALLVVTFVGRVFLVWLRVEVEGPHRGMHKGLVCQIDSTGKLLVRLRDLQDSMEGAACWLGGGGEEQLGCQGVVSLEGCTEKGLGRILRWEVRGQEDIVTLNFS